MHRQQLGSRLHAFRHDLANERLKGRVDAERFVEGEVGVMVHSVADLMKSSNISTDVNIGRLSQLLYGERVLVFERNTETGMCWVQSQTDGYVGYVDGRVLQNLSPQALDADAQHVVTVPATFVYEQPSIKSSVVMPLYLNSVVRIGEKDREFCAVYGIGEAMEQHPLGWIYTLHIKPVSEPKPLTLQKILEAVTIAEQFIGVPYLWGGKTMAGLDCSGLVQISLQAAGVAKVLRDSDMQQNTLGVPLESWTTEAYRGGAAPPLERGDLLFHKGHVGWMLDSDTLLHANGHHMQVVAEPLPTALARFTEQGKASTVRIHRHT